MSTMARGRLGLGAPARAGLGAPARAGLGIVLGLVLLFGQAPVALVQAAEKVLFTAVIDAGSSGTRLHLYKVKPGPYPTVTEIGVFENDDAEDGIDDFINNASAHGGATAHHQRFRQQHTRPPRFW
jgi:hypothetical protein